MRHLKQSDRIIQFLKMISLLEKVLMVCLYQGCALTDIMLQKVSRFIPKRLGRLSLEKEVDNWFATMQLRSANITFLNRRQTTML